MRMGPKAHENGTHGSGGEGNVMELAPLEEDRDDGGS